MVQGSQEHNAQIGPMPTLANYHWSSCHENARLPALGAQWVLVGLVVALAAVGASSSLSGASQMGQLEVGAASRVALGSSERLQVDDKIELVQAPPDYQQRLTRPPASSNLQDNDPASQAANPRSGRQPRIYRIRASPINGRLGPPIRLDQLMGLERPPGGHLLGPQVNRSEPQSGLQQAAALPFGARSSPATNLRQLNLHQHQQLASIKAPPVGPSKWAGQRQTQAPTGVVCSNNQSQASMEEAAGNSFLGSQSIAASSPTLHLVAPAGARAHPGPVQAGQDGDRAPAREIDESEAEARQPKAPARGQTETSAEGPEDPDDGRSSSSSNIGNHKQQQAPNLIDEFDSRMVTNRAKAQLSCDSSEMILRLNFSEPFRGIVYPDHNRLSPCRFFGDGHHNYELRLPLRACGTRQVAPRIFLNDVIVRFHKTLELEEDEVKTLICRYPPPLALQTQPFGQGLLHELEPTTATPIYSAAGGQQNQRRPSGGHQYESPVSGQQPFELVDTASGQTAHGVGAGGLLNSQLETLGGQLLSSRANQLNKKSPFDHSIKTISQQFEDQVQQQQQFGRQKNANIIGPPAGGGGDLVSSSGGVIGRINGATAGDAPQQRGPGLLDRLTSIELLFLISALMFLLLLGLGLLAAYYCCRRRRPRSASARAGAILRKGRYLGSSGAASGPARGLHRPASAAALHHHHHSRPEANQVRAAGDLYQANQATQYYGVRPTVASTFYGRQQTITEPSSPESDQSSGHQVLLPAAKSYHQLTTEHKLLKHRHHQQYDQPNVCNLIGAGINAPPVVGRRADAAIYDASTPQGRASQQHLQAHYQTGGRRQQRPATMTQQQIYAANKDKSHTLNRHVVASARQPLLQMVNTNPGDIHAGGQYQNNTFDRFSWRNGGPMGEQMRVSRAKSMQQLPGMAEDPTGDGWRSLSRRPMPQGQPNTGATRGRRASGKPRQMVSKTASILKPRPFNQPGDHYFDHLTQELIGDGDPQVSSDSEIELNNGTNNQRHWHNKEPKKYNHRLQEHSKTAGLGELHKPRIFLKSIEDSFITNVTEIHEQEYIKEDSRKLLSWAKWRTMQPNPFGGGKPGKGDGGDGSKKDDGKNFNTSQADDEDDDDQYQSHQANLRSLTELDVNFAKSLLLNPEGTTGRQAAVNRHTIASTINKSDVKNPTEDLADEVNESKLDGQQDKNEPAGGARGQLDEKIRISVRNDNPLSHDNQTSTEKVIVRESSNGSKLSSTRQPQSPDLIISPEYDCDLSERLKLTSSPTSQNSISYV